jgi:hypothetical protein
MTVVVVVPLLVIDSLTRLPSPSYALFPRTPQ